MILVTLGTQKQQFNRLLSKIEESKIKDKIIVQSGFTKFKSKKMEIFDFISYEEMNKLIDEADLIITHGGTGSILMPLSKSKKVIACARLSKYGEHIDNHQTEIVDLFSSKGYIIKMDETDDIDDLIKKTKKFTIKKYKTNRDNFIKKLKQLIEE